MPNLNAKTIFMTVATFQVATTVAVLFNVPVARQVFGAVFLLFVPGFVSLSLLKMERLDTVEKLLFSVGLSVALTMLIGLVTDQLGTIAGFSQPLTLLPVMIALQAYTLLAAAFTHFRLEKQHQRSSKSLKIAVIVLLSAIAIVLCTFGVYYYVSPSRNMFLVAGLVTLAALMILTVAWAKNLPGGLLALVVLTVSVALLFQTSLASPYIFGSDIHTEYYMMKLTRDSGYWNASRYFSDPGYGRFNTMLSVTILPAVYSEFLGGDLTWVIKIMLPAMFSLVPLGLYKFWQETVDRKQALIATFLLVSQMTFFTEMLELARQMVAEFFLVLLVLLLFRSKNQFDWKGKLLFVLFTFSLAASHYALSLIFLFYILSVWAALRVFKRKIAILNSSLVLTAFVVTFFWYIYTSYSAPFQSILQFADNVYRNLGDFFNPASRGTEVARGLGMEAATSTLQLLSRGFAYATQLFIVVGFLVVTLRRKKTGGNGMESFVLYSTNMVLLGLCIALPNFAATLNMTRFYHIVLFFLAPLFAIGCGTFVGFALRRKHELAASALMMAIIVPYFLFQTGLVYELAGTQTWSISLGKYRMGQSLNVDFGYVTAQEVASAEWLNANTEQENLRVYADFHIFCALAGYGSIYRDSLIMLSNTSQPASNEYAYLGELAVRYGKIIGSDSWNTTDIVDFGSFTTIYTSGDCVIIENTAGTP